MPFNCPQAISKLKAYKQQHQDLKQQFSDFMSQVPFLPDVKWDEPFMSSPYYKDITKTSKEIFDNLYDAKEEARKKLEEFKEEIGYQEPITEKEFLKLTYEQKIDYLYSRCCKPRQKSDELLEYQKPVPDLRRYELEFLYYEYFNTLDKRLRALISHRDKNADMLKIFDCTPNQVVHNQQELQQAIKDKIEIKAYVGELFPNFFQVLPQNVEYIYTEFPEGKIKQKTIKLGTGLKTKADFVKAIKAQGGVIDDWAKHLMGQPDFVVSDQESEKNIIIITMDCLGIPYGEKIEKIFKKAKDLGLEFCPPEIGPQLRLQYQKQTIYEKYYIGMKQNKSLIFCVNIFEELPFLDCVDTSVKVFGYGDSFVFVRPNKN